MFQSSSIPVSYYRNKLSARDWEILELMLGELRLIEGSSVQSLNIMAHNGNLIGISIDKHLHYLPKTIEELENLETIMVSTDEPPSLRGMKRLTTLSIQNLKSCDLPPHYGSLTSLEFVFLPNNGFTSYPTFLQNLSKLRYLDLSNNFLTVLPETVSKNSRLQSLILSRNRISHIHPKISLLRELKVLKLNNNKLHKLPSTFQMLFGLEELDLDDNPLDETLTYVMNLPNLRTLRISHHLRKRFSLQLPNSND